MRKEHEEALKAMKAKAAQAHIHLFLLYETANMPVPLQFISNRFIQNIISKYYSWKVSRKFRRLQEFLIKGAYFAKEKAELQAKEKKKDESV